MARLMWRDSLAWGLLAAALALLLWQARAWHQAEQVNQLLMHPSIANAAMGTTEGRFVVAWCLAQQEDMRAEALKRYGWLEREGNTVLQAQVKYNMGNLYLKSALAALRDDGALAYNNVVPLLAMAKESYRQSLLLQPDSWDARNNMELAQRASPDIMTPGVRNEPEQDEKLVTSNEKAWPTIPGFPKGMP